MAGEIFDKKYGLNKQEEKDFLKNGSIDVMKLEAKGDLNKLEEMVIRNYHSENFDKISSSRIDQIKNVVGTDFYSKNLKVKTGGTEGIAALQMLAMKCVNVMKINGNDKIVEDMLKNEYIKSGAVDGVLGPNTLFVLKEISKTELGGQAMADWNGIIDEGLLDKMINICGQPKKEEPKKEEPKKEEPKKEEPKKEEPKKEEPKKEEPKKEEPKKEEPKKEEPKKEEPKKEEPKKEEPKKEEPKKEEPKKEPEKKLEFGTNILQAVLKGKLAGVTLDSVVNGVAKLKNTEVREKIKEYLLKGDVKSMQIYLGMKEGSKYKDNKADGLLGRLTLNRMTNPLFGLKGSEIENNSNIAKDVKEVYKYFETHNQNLGLNFAIVSKSDFNMYVFSADHRLISKNPVLLGKDKGDRANDAYEKDGTTSTRNGFKTTPGGMYSIPEDSQSPGNKAHIFSSEYAGPGEYVALYPEENQYDVKNPDGFTLGFHNYYLGKDRKGERVKLFSEVNLDKKRVSSGCINTLSEGVIYDNLGLKSKVYVTKEIS